MALHHKEVCGTEMAKTIQLLIEYDPKPPFDSGSIAKAEPSIVELKEPCPGCVQVNAYRFCNAWDKPVPLA